MTGTRLNPRVGVGLALVACLVAVLLGQAGTDRLAPSGRSESTGRTVGRAAFAYVSGLRVFAAQVLWNRLDPQHHEYYAGLTIGKELFLLPNLRLIMLLDPQFVAAYYEVPWILADNDRIADALAVAREGVTNNPKSGLLHASYAQILYLKTRDIAGAVEQADLALQPDTFWTDETEQWESLRIVEDVYIKAGEKDKAARVTAILDALSAKWGPTGTPPNSAASGDHDHNGDGKQDH